MNQITLDSTAVVKIKDLLAEENIPIKKSKK